MLMKDQTVIVTGAASAKGLGKATAKLMAEHGARVAIVDLDQEKAAAAAADLGAGHIGLACDVTKHAACKTVVERVLKEFGRIDVLVNNAGITQPLKIMDIAPENYDQVLDVSLRGTLNMSQAVIPHMRSRRKGAIVCISSVSAQRGGGIFGGPHYSAAKAGVMGLAKAMARELGPDNVRVNIVAPGLIMTEINEGKLTDAMQARILEGIPLNRLGKPVDVARICLFLGSELSEYVTGAVVDINGGMHIH